MHSRRGGIGRRAPKITDVHRYVVVALLEPLPAGTVFPASQWPLHVTLSTNFDVVAEPEAVAAIIAETVTDRTPRCRPGTGRTRQCSPPGGACFSTRSPSWIGRRRAVTVPGASPRSLRSRPNPE
jgi:hypothetical protein